jgi:hypothetical protein
MAEYCGKSGTVVDFGCGEMWLEKCLKPLHKYVPLDMIRRDERTIVHDFRSTPLPNIRGDVAFLSGILEYLPNPEQFLVYLSSMGFSRIVMSYCTTEKFSDFGQRNDFGWISHLSALDILGIMCSRYVLSSMDEWQSNTIFVLDRHDTSS